MTPLGQSRQKAKHRRLPLGNFKPISIVMLTNQESMHEFRRALNVKPGYTVHNCVFVEGCRKSAIF